MILLLGFIIISLFFPTTTSAANDFTLNQTIAYTIDAAGNGQVNHQISLTNNLSIVYAKDYIIKIQSNDINNVLGHDDQDNNIVKNVSHDNNITTINLNFPHPAVGKNNQKKFTLTYSINNLAQKKGKTWEVNLPVAAADTSSQISLTVPSAFGTLSYSSQKPALTTPVGDKLEFQFTTTDSQRQILVAFGNAQLFDFNLNYHLQNKQSQTVVQAISLPPDTASQKITFAKIDPTPQQITVDDDGNWLARYTLSPSSTLDIQVMGQAKITEPKINYPSILPDGETKTDTYWPTTDPQITAIAATLATPRSIYDYVVATLNYNYTQINTARRQGALNALANPNGAVCTEFTDLFITLARAKGIPAREIEGFAFSNNPKLKPVADQTDVLHAWPEYWDQNLHHWIAVDPTWGKTTNGIDYFDDLDLNHLTFVIHGQKSTSPPPPGAYKTTAATKTVTVTFAGQELQPAVTPLSFNLTSTNFFENPKLTVKNTNLFSLTDVKIAAPQITWQVAPSSMPPLSTLTFDIPTMSFLTSISSSGQNLTVNTSSFADPTVVTSHLFYPLHFRNLLIVIVSGLLILASGGIIITTKIL